jgi:predicted dienelactone hydrolase
MLSGALRRLTAVSHALLPERDLGIIKNRETIWNLRNFFWGDVVLKLKVGYSNVYAILGILLGTLAFLNYLFPLNHMPFPSGPHSMGFRSFEVTNPEPIGLSGISYSDSAKIRLDIWYPADEVSGYERKGWINNDPIVFEGFEIMTGYPKDLFEHLYRVRTNSFTGAPPSMDSSSWPVVILLLGWSSISELHTSLAESLASSGYLVA